MFCFLTFYIQYNLHPVGEIVQNQFDKTKNVD